MPSNVYISFVDHNRKIRRIVRNQRKLNMRHINTYLDFSSSFFSSFLIPWTQLFTRVRPVCSSSLIVGCWHLCRLYIPILWIFCFHCFEPIWILQSFHLNHHEFWKVFTSRLFVIQFNPYLNLLLLLNAFVFHFRLLLGDVSCSIIIKAHNTLVLWD